MIDVEKSNMQHETNARRTRRRKRGLSLYVFAVLILALGTIITLSMTLFFNIKTIRVTGIAENYKAEDIVAASGIQIGDNLVRLDKKAAEERALEALKVVEDIAEKGSKMAISDAGVSGDFLSTALKGSSLNVLINARSMQDQAHREDFVERCTALLDEGAPIQNRISAVVSKRI